MVYSHTLGDPYIRSRTLTSGLQAHSKVPITTIGDNVDIVMHIMECLEDFMKEVFSVKRAVKTACFVRNSVE